MLRDLGIGFPLSAAVTRLIRPRLAATVIAVLGGVDETSGVLRRGGLLFLVWFLLLRWGRWIPSE